MQSKGTKRRATRRGAVMVYSLVAMVAFVAVCSLAVDYGRVQLAKTELQSAADAAARAGAAGLYDGTAVAKATECAKYNKADGTDVLLSKAANSPDVRLGRWDPAEHQFVDGGYPVDAVQVTTRRTKATGNGVPLAFGSLLGQRTCDVTCVAVASSAPDGFAVVGLDYIKMSGNSTDSYWSTTGRTEIYYGSIASNGDITLGGSTQVQGIARPGVGRRVDGERHVSGKVVPLTKPLVYPNGDAGKAAVDNDNRLVPAWALVNGSLVLKGNKSLTLPGGTYYFKDFDLNGGSSVDFVGPATVYVYGSLSLHGNVRTSGNQPKNLKVVMCPGPTGAAPGSAYVGGNAALYASVYAPQSPVTLRGTGDLYGRVVGKSIDQVGNSAIHYDLALDNRGEIKLMQ